MDISPLTVAQRKGLIAVTSLAFLSFLATASLLCFITYRLVFWRSIHKRYIGYNQYIVLIYNLVLADFQQSLAYLLCLRWISTNEIKSGTPICFLQGLWLQVGNPGSGLFVLAIAFHTFFLVALGRKMPYKVFVAFICGVWGFVAVLAIIPIAVYGRDVFVPSDGWCWINQDYKNMRLFAHYIWIFLAEFCTVCLYSVMYFQLRKQIAQSAILENTQQESLIRLRRVIGYMTIYPLVYVVLSLPIAAGRMAMENGDSPSITFFCAAGAIMTSSGLIDVILYTLTRRNLIIDSEFSQHRSYNNFSSKRNRRGDTRLTSITARKNSRELGAIVEARERNSSTDNIIQSGVEMENLGKVYKETTIQIISEPRYPPEGAKNHHTKDEDGVWSRSD